ncbi:hypothetical protein PR048_028448 [Dryococelus australis]|uniref:DUF4817 domain-containing protein n=1 Tax=Dryococelus australis TaxID=614101 RepID=A0ABQ9GDD7_9NEOP|nr:hypothetical protein PR048_028448 [Dryococelus australis]
MVFIYGECHRSIRAAVRLCAERYPDRATIARAAFANLRLHTIHLSARGSLTVRVVSVNGVFCEYYTAANSIFSTFHFINCYMEITFDFGCIWLREVDEQRPWPVNAWRGVVHNRLIGPYFIDATQHGIKYLQFLTEMLPQLLKDIPLT